jgi:outer membrane receptor protein involved in Fe transport
MLKWHGTINNWEYDGTTPFITEDDETGQLIANGNVNLTGTKIGQAPQVSTGAGTVIDIWDNFSVDADLNLYTELYGFVDTQDVITASQSGQVFQSERLPAYTLLDAGATYNFDLGDNNLEIRGNVYNLFDADYISQKDSFGYYLGIGRTFNISARYNF